jgi:phenylalanyl-tRNA synthetase beta chain
MLAPISWLKDYVDITVSPETLAKKLVAIGFEVEQIVYQNKTVSNVVVGRIAAVERHPNADRLRVTKIDIGSKVLQVVTNVPVEGGETVALALDGALLADGHTIKSGELRGVLSQGMLCGLEELGLSTDDVSGQKKDDIVRFPDGTRLGQNALDALGYNDVILDVGVTANRPDCNSIYKLAKEVAVAIKSSCREPEISYETAGGSVSDEVMVEVKNNKLCPRYIAASVKNIKIFPSPQKIKSRLRAVGIRPINNIVDITNYVLIEIGQPMHAFDRRELTDGKIVVRTAEDNEHIVTLDGKDNALNSSMLVICDASRPVAVAGVMGGENSGIKDDTAQIIFESAAFARDNIRRTSRALNLRSDSSARFEKGIDFASQEYGIKRALTLIYQLKCGDITNGLIDVCVPYEKTREISFTLKKISDILGCAVPKQTFVTILKKLGINVTGSGKLLTAIVPEDREDIVGANDLAEEFIRVYGYSHITPTLFQNAGLTKGGKNANMLFADKVKAALSAAGLNECVSYSFTSPKFAELLLLDKDSPLRNTVKLMNPLGEAMSVMRTTLVHSMIEILTSNFAHFNKKAAMFEIGKVYFPKPKPQKNSFADEKERLILGMYGGDTDFFTLKAAVEQLMLKLGITAEYRKSTITFLHPGRCADVFVSGVKLGFIGEVHPDSASKYGAEGVRLYVAEFSMEELKNAAKQDIKFKAFSKFPIMERDLAVIVPDSVSAGDMLKAIESAKIDKLIKSEVFDAYKSAQIGENKKSIALSFAFASNERTLTDEEVSAQTKRILSVLKRKFDAKLR